MALTNFIRAIFGIHLDGIRLDSARRSGHSRQIWAYSYRKGRNDPNHLSRYTPITRIEQNMPRMPQIAPRIHPNRHPNTEQNTGE